jgi:hypothetical protein
MRKYYSLILLVLIVLVVTGSYLWYRLEPRRTLNIKNQQIISDVTHRLEAVLQRPSCIATHFIAPQDDQSPMCNSVLFWYEDGHNMVLHNARVEYVFYPGDFSLDYNKLKRQIAIFFANKGFVVDTEATRVIDSWGNGDQQDYFFSFKKNDLYCSTVLPQLFATGRSAHIPPYIEVGCGYYNVSDESIYQEFEAIANPHHEPGTFFWREAQEGDFVRLGIFNREVQSALLLKKVDSLWTSPFQFSNDYQKCSDVDRLGFPVSVYKNCMLGDYSLRYKE